MEFEANEVKQFLDARYVGPPEAAWRLFAFPMHDKSHNVERLAVHLKGGETITFQDGQEREAVAASAKTTLTVWFSLNAEDPDGQEPRARSLHYAQIPEHFVWNKKEGKWQRRQRTPVANRVIGRLHSANPSEGPRFYLYLLLPHKKGATSFEDLVTITKHNGDRQTFFE